MSREIVDTIQASLQIKNLPVGQCFISFEALVQALPNFLSVQIPSTISNVVVGNEQPGEDEKNDLWVRQDSSGNTLGLYIFTSGKWQPLYYPPTGQVFWFNGDSTNVPPGFTNTDASTVSAAVKTALKAMWVLESSKYTYYSAVYTGF